MKKRFIVFIDFSDYSAKLLQYACDWCKETDAELLLVHQTTILTPVLTDHENKQTIISHTNQEALEQLKGLAKELIPENRKVSFWVTEKHIQHILTQVLTKPFDHLLFVGLKGTGFLKKLFIGSTALQIIEEANNVVVALPKEIYAFSHRKIYVAVKMQYPLNTVALKGFFRFIDPNNTHITFFYLCKEKENTTKIKSHLKELSQSFDPKYATDYTVYEGEDPFSDIAQVINNKIEELLIVQKGSRLLTDLFFRRFLINHLVYKGQTPLIILP